MFLGCQPLPDTIIVPLAVDTDLDGGRFEAPLVEVAEMNGAGGAIGPFGWSGQTGMHNYELQYRDGVDVLAGSRPDQVAGCSNTFTLYNVDNPSQPGMLAQGWTFEHEDVDLDGDGAITSGVDLIHAGRRRPGCHHLAFDETGPGIVWVTNHGTELDGDSFLSGIALNGVLATEDNTYWVAPRPLPMRYEDGTSFEGLDVENGLLYVARHARGVGVYEPDPLTGKLDRVGEHVGTLQNAFSVLVSGNLAYVADGAAGVVVLDVSDPLAIGELGAVPIAGTTYDVALDGTWLYVAAGSGGVVVVDVSDPSAPAVAATVSGSGTVLDVHTDGQRLFVAAWTDARVYDVSDPTAPTMIGAVRKEAEIDFPGDGGVRPDGNNRVLTVTGRGDILYDGTWNVPYSYEVHPERTAPYIVLPETLQQLVIPGDLAVGEVSSVDVEARNDGNEPLTIVDIWAANPAFSVTPTQLYVLPGATATFRVTFTPTEGLPADGSGSSGTLPEEASTFYVVSDDPTQPVRAGYLFGNAASLSVGDRFPETVATLEDGSQWSFGTDSADAVTLISYWATFCPVCATELPDLETAFWQPYRDRGLNMIALNADDDEALDPALVWAFAEFTGVTFPVGIDEGDTFELLTANTSGLSPYPLDLLVDREGVIRYLSLEYDPDAMLPVVESLLAEAPRP